MKKWISLVIVLIFIFTMTTACQEKHKPKYEDGTFDAESEYDDNGWKGSIDIEVKDGKITKVNYNELNKDGEKKSEDDDYSASMEESSGISPKEAYGQLEKSLIEAQDPDELEAVSGATGSSGVFKDLANHALKIKNK